MIKKVPTSTRKYPQVTIDYSLPRENSAELLTTEIAALLQALYKYLCYCVCVKTFFISGIIR